MPKSAICAATARAAVENTGVNAIRPRCGALRGSGDRGADVGASAHVATATAHSRVARDRTGTRLMTTPVDGGGGWGGGRAGDRRARGIQPRNDLIVRHQINSTCRDLSNPSNALRAREEYQFFV